ncbi:dTDP-4-dehydrorhamnose reductase [Cardinium endosymbiont of Tipula unca]|uniref:dTDP-4-dehydrorhamnose reductase n=1 Tax=Cardinium endosymbiont of Tipula unca TaxID=3066216 RepID=UPI0030D15DEB
MGRALQAAFKSPDAFTPLFCNKKALDITNLNQVELYITKHDIKCIVNCAAYTNVQLAEQETEACFRVNSVGAGYLAALSKKYKIPLIHISTDYVFGTTLGRPFKPNDLTDPLNQYGRAKLAGEQLVAATAAQYYIIRTSWLYGEHGDNFFTRMIEFARKGLSIQMVDDQIGSPTYICDLASTIWDIVEQVTQNNPDRFPSGIYHYTNEGVASWYDFAYAILDNFPSGATLMPIASIQTAVKRPYYSVLDKSSFRETFQKNIPHWQHSLSACCANFQRIFGCSL